MMFDWTGLAGSLLRRRPVVLDETLKVNKFQIKRANIIAFFNRVPKAFLESHLRAKPDPGTPLQTP